MVSLTIAPSGSRSQASSMVLPKVPTGRFGKLPLSLEMCYVFTFAPESYAPFFKSCFNP